MVVSAHDLKRDRLSAGEVQMTTKFLGVKKCGGAGHEWLPKDTACTHRRRTFQINVLLHLCGESEYGGVGITYALNRTDAYHLNSKKRNMTSADYYTQ